ncbi:MAG: DUF4304 domain-containing protein [bacterium]
MTAFDAARPLLESHGFRVRGKIFNRVTLDSLTQVVGFQSGRGDSPGKRLVPGFRKDLRDHYTVNLGVYVPEVARYLLGEEFDGWIREYHCCVRARLGELTADRRDLWWPVDGVKGGEEVLRLLENVAIPFLENLRTRDDLLAYGETDPEPLAASASPRVVSAILRAERGESEFAAELLASEWRQAANDGQRASLRELASSLGLSVPGPPGSKEG